MHADARYVVPIPPSLALHEAAPILCAGLTSYKALKETHCRAGEYVAVTGASGGLGGLALQYAAAMGMKTVALVRGKAKAQYVHDTYHPFLTVDTTLLPTAHATAAAVAEATEGGVHGVVSTAPAVAAIENAVPLLRSGGTLVVVGIPPGDFTLSTPDLVMRGISIKGSLVGTRQDLREALALAADGKVQCEVELQPLDTCKQVLQRLQQHRVKGRVVFTLDGRPVDKTMETKAYLG